MPAKSGITWNWGGKKISQQEVAVLRYRHQRGAEDRPIVARGPRGGEVGWFLNWQGRQGIENLTTRLEADSTVVRGWGQVPRERRTRYMLARGLLPQPTEETEAEAQSALN